MKAIVLCFLLLVVNIHARAFTVVIQQTGTAANSCTRTLTAVVSGGSGYFSYTWSIVTPAMAWPGPNNVSTVHLGLNQMADVNVSVKDLVTNQITSDTQTVYRILTGSFNTFIPNLITPNGDGFNDSWIVTDATKGAGPINAYSFALAIRNSASTQVFEDDGTATSGHLGIHGGDILWNGKLNGTGSIVPVGTYSYMLTLENCSQRTNYNGAIVVVY